MSKRVIGLAGRARGGKTTLANHLKEKYGAVVIPMALALKTMCADIMGVTVDELNERKANKTPFTEEEQGGIREGIIKKCSDITHDFANFSEIIEGKLNDHGNIIDVRDLLQFVGTEMIRGYNPEWHVQQTIAAINSLPEDSLVVIDDIRFPNEKEMVEDNLGGLCFFIIRPDMYSQVSNHASETSLNYMDFIDIQGEESNARIIFNDNWECELLGKKPMHYLLNSLDWFVEHDGFKDVENGFLHNKAKYFKGLYRGNGLRLRCGADYDFMQKLIENGQVNIEFYDVPLSETRYAVNNPQTFVGIKTKIKDRLLKDILVDMFYSSGNHMDYKNNILIVNNAYDREFLKRFV